MLVRTPALPGLALAALGAAIALSVHAVVPQLSPTLVAIALGMVCSLVLARHARAASATRPGLRIASRRVLRVGVALLGLQLVLPEILALGWPMLGVIVGVVLLGIGGTLALARPLGVPPERALLVACGFSICGAAAVAAVEGVRRSRDEDVATVVSLVVVFGSVAMLALPLGAAMLGLSATAAGAWAGASVHEVGQVVVAGGLVGGVALQVAVAVKLGRVLMLAPVLAAISWWSRRESRDAVRRPPLVPGFVLVFLAGALLRTVAPVPAGVLDAAELVQSSALAAAMFALGCALEFAVLRRTGGRLLGLAAAATGLVALLGLPAVLVAG